MKRTWVQVISVSLWQETGLGWHVAGEAENPAAGASNQCEAMDSTTTVGHRLQ